MSPTGVGTYGTGVVLVDVLCTARAGDDAELQFGSVNSGGGNLYVVDPNASISIGVTPSMRTALRTDNVFQVEFGKFNVSNGLFVTYSMAPQNVTTFVDELSDVTMSVDEGFSVDNSLCITSKSSVNTTAKAIAGDPHPLSSVIPAGSPCVKKPIPERVPEYINPVAASNAMPKPAPTSAATFASKSLGAVTSFVIVTLHVAGASVGEARGKYQTVSAHKKRTHPSHLRDSLVLQRQ